MNIFITAFTNTISRMKSRLTPFSLRLLCLLTVLSFVVPIDVSGSTTQQVFRLVITAMLVISATIFFVEYLYSLEVLMWKTTFRERSILNIFVKYADPRYHVYANLSTITMTSLAIVVAFVAATHILLPIMFSLIFVAMVTVLSIP